MLIIYASPVGQSVRSHSLEISWYFARHQVQKHKVSVGVLIMVKNCTPQEDQTIRSHTFQFSWSFERHQVSKYELFQGVLIMLKNYASPMSQIIRSHSF